MESMSKEQQDKSELSHNLMPGGPNVIAIHRQINDELFTKAQPSKSYDRIRTWQLKKEAKAEEQLAETAKTQETFPFKPHMDPHSQKLLSKSQKTSVVQRNAEWETRRKEQIQEKLRKSLEERRRQEELDRHWVVPPNKNYKVESKVRAYMEPARAVSPIKGFQVYYEVLEKIDDTPVGFRHSQERVRRNSRSPMPASREPEWMKARPNMVAFQRALHDKINSN